MPSKFAPIIWAAGNDGNEPFSKAESGDGPVKKTRRTEKTVEIHEFYAIRTANGSLPALCAECPEGDAVMLPPDHAALY